MTFSNLTTTLVYGKINQHITFLKPTLIWDTDLRLPSINDAK